MTTEEGIVIDVKGEIARIKTQKTGACESCSVQSSCHTFGGGKDMEVDATPGTAIYIPPDAKHSIVNDGPEKFVIVYGLNAPTRRFVWDKPLEK